MKKLSLLLGIIFVMGTASFAGDDGAKSCCAGKKEACSKEKLAACEKGTGCCKKGDAPKSTAAPKDAQTHADQKLEKSTIKVQPAAKKTAMAK